MRAPWGKATPGVRAGGALCFFLDMPRLSATEPRKDRMPSRPSPAVQLGAVQPAGTLGWYDFTPPCSPVRVFAPPCILIPTHSSHGRLRTLTIAKVNTYTVNY